MGNIRFQYSLRDIDGPGKRVPYKMHRAPGCDPHIFRGGGKPDIFRPGFLRRVVLVLKGYVQEDLHPPDQPVNADGRYQDARCTAAELCGPVSALMKIKPRNALHLTALLNQPLCQGAAQKIGRGALKSQAVDLFIRKPPLLRAQVRPVCGSQGQHFQQQGIGLVYFLGADTFRLGNPGFLLAAGAKAP